MSVLVKICGITNVSDALDAIEAGADFLGLNFYPDSPRYIGYEQAMEIKQEVPQNIKLVGVFVNEGFEKVRDWAVALELDMLQFHGDESPSYCQDFGRTWMKAFRLKDKTDLAKIPAYESDYILVDAYVEKAFGGTGVVSNWDLAREAKQYGKLFLSGGLKPDNIELALRSVKPYAVDVASGVESSPGVKDLFKMQEFVARVKEVGGREE